MHKYKLRRNRFDNCDNRDKINGNKMEWNMETCELGDAETKNYWQIL